MTADYFTGTVRAGQKVKNAKHCFISSIYFHKLNEKNFTFDLKVVPLMVVFL